MLTLIIDTSHKFLAVGLADDQKGIIYSKQEQVKKKQSEMLIPFIDEMMQDYAFKPNDIKRIVVTDGPGSYTGMRVGLTFVKTFALVNHGVEVYTVNTLLSLSGLRSGFSMIDARSGRVFGAFVESGEVNEEKIYELATIEKLNLKIHGDRHLLNLSVKTPNVIENIWEVKSFWRKVEDIDQLVPRYVK